MAVSRLSFTTGLPAVLLCACLLWIGATCCAATVEVQMLDGSQRQGTLVQWDARQVTLDHKGELATYPAESILEVRQPEVPTASLLDRAYIEFVDGTVIPLTQYAAQASKATVETPLLEAPINVRTSAVNVVQFPSENPPPKWREKWSTLEPTGDTVVVLKKEGTEIDILEGVVGDVTPEHVSFTWSGDTLDVKRSKLAGLTYFHAAEDPRRVLAHVRLADGSILAVKDLNFAQDHLTLETSLGFKLQVSPDGLSSADFSAGKLTYLSTLTPRSEKWTPLIELPVPPELTQEYGRMRQDESFAGDPLQLVWPPEEGMYAGAQKVFRRGLAIRSRTELKYLVPDEAKTFLALAGIDPLTAQVGSVQLKILLDGEVAFDTEISGRSAPQEVQLEVAGKKRITILVDYGQNQDLGDRLHLVEARFTK